MGLARPGGGAKCVGMTADAAFEQGGGTALEVCVLAGLGEIEAAEWDACACPEAADGGRPHDPFTTHRVLLAMEESGSVGPGTGWQAQHLVVREGGAAVAVMPLYAKGHSQGEYIFDHNWAHAWERAGGRYYPKLQAAVPFTPATGRRFLVRPGREAEGMAALVQGAAALLERHGLSSFHATFCTEGEAARGEAMGLLRRATQQYHWLNDGYGDFDAFLAALSSRKRKAIRKERAGAGGFGGRILELTGDDLRPAHWDAFWRFYQDTGARKWGQPYLTRAFFDLVQERLRDDVVLMLAEREGRYVAGALNFAGRDVLYGRYWGCTEHHPFLHFELCYYRAIDWAIRHGLDRVEAGAQGDHKLARGYLPATCHSLHLIADAGFRDAVARYLEAERQAVAEEVEVLTAYGPFRRAQVEEQE
jgi:predicted N-acyltransferase